jgi:DNA-binding HxlR family transcriptional regulator/putative sterol carrier protein
MTYTKKCLECTPVPKESYPQYCSMARALEVVGDRWTLLIVRELSFGPRRFTDLVDGLPDISRNLLSRRLRELEEQGVLRRGELPPPAARQVYELTNDGHDLAKAMLPLAAWGVRRLGKRQADQAYRPHWAAVAMAGFANRVAASGVHDTYQFVVDEQPFYFRVDDGDLELHDGLAEAADLTITTDDETWAAIASGDQSAQEAAAARRLAFEGSAEAGRRLAAIFSPEAILDDQGRPRATGAGV